VSRREVLHCHYHLALLCAALNDVDALTEHATVLEAASDGSRYPQAHADLAAGLVALAHGRVGDAEARLLAAIDTLASIPIVESVADAVAALASCAGARGDEARATRLTHLAAGLRDGSRSVDSVAEVIA
jgi:uncharacterized protein HemY